MATWADCQQHEFIVTAKKMQRELSIPFHEAAEKLAAEDPDLHAEFVALSRTQKPTSAPRVRSL